jgi:hypothetical protein
MLVLCLCVPLSVGIIRRARMLSKKGKNKDAVRVLREHMNYEVGGG